MKTKEGQIFEWVEANPILWNQKDREFKNKQKKDRMWDEKAQEREIYFCYRTSVHSMSLLRNSLRQK